MKIFVAGLSKSGKTSRSIHAAEQLTQIEYVSVSQILRKTGSVFPVATLAEGLTNQRQAADALVALPDSKKNQIIDGHLLIETLEGPLLVPDWFFDQIKPDLIFYIMDRPEEILARRESTASLHATAEIVSLAAIEMAACERIVSKLRIPLVTLRTPSLDRFSQEVRSRLTPN